MHHEEDIEVRGLSVVARYTITAITLGLITALEVLVLYPPLAHFSDNPKIALLCLLGLTKFIIVVALFMHLWSDDPLFTGIFSLGMLLGGGTAVALVAVMSVYPYRSDALKHPPLREIYEKRAKERGEMIMPGEGAYHRSPRLAGVQSA